MLVGILDLAVYVKMGFNYFFKTGSKILETVKLKQLYKLFFVATNLYNCFIQNEGITMCLEIN